MADYNPVTKPAHYIGNGKIECKDAVESMFSQYRFIPPATIYWAGCAFKYLWRWPLKGGLQDVEKAIECLQNIRKILEANEGEE